MHLRLLFILFLTLLTKHAGAATPSLNDMIYDRVYTHCSSGSQDLTNAMHFVESMNYSFDSVNAVINFDTAPIHQALKDRGLSPTMSMVLNSGALPAALSRCFPQSEEMRNAFVLKMIAADVLGRGMGTIQGFALAYLQFRTGFWAIERSYHLLQLTRYAKFFVPEMKSRYMAIVAGYFFGQDSVNKGVQAYRNKMQAQTADAKRLAEYDHLLESASLELQKAIGSSDSQCTKSSDAYQVSLIIQDIFQALQKTAGTEGILGKHRGLYQQSLTIQPCTSLTKNP